MDSITSVIVGVVCIIIGISNRKGNISMLHSYHVKRVSEENRLPFGKMVGIGMIIIGVSLILMGGLTFMATVLQERAYLTIGIAVLAVGMVAGLGVSFYAMMRHNKGIF